MGRIADIFDLTPAASTGFVGRIERHGQVRVIALLRTYLAPYHGPLALVAAS